jgi:hypothetical protein
MMPASSDALDKAHESEIPVQLLPEGPQPEPKATENLISPECFRYSTKTSRSLSRRSGPRGRFIFQKP